MPELPEVESARRVLADGALHRRIVDVDDRDDYVTRPLTPGVLRSVLTGRYFTAAHRRGKSMWLTTSGTDADPQPGPDLGVHLGMSGIVVASGPAGLDLVGGDYRRDREQFVVRGAYQRFGLTFADGAACDCWIRADCPGCGWTRTSTCSARTPWVCRRPPSAQR